MSNVRIGLVQMVMTEDPEDNLKKAIHLIEITAHKGASVVALPELFTRQYFAQYHSGKESAVEFTETIPGRTSDALCHAAKESGIWIVGGSIYERDGDHRYNTSLLIDPQGKIAGKYRKTHIPHDPRYWEQDYFEPGDTGFQVIETPLGNLGLMICYDQWFPEAARINALMGADVVFYPTAIGVAPDVGEEEGSWQEAWETVMRGHAIANGMVVVAINRGGKEGDISFYGGSFICDAFGTILARARDGEEILIADINVEHGRHVREKWRFFPERRPECYGPITKRV